MTRPIVMLDIDGVLADFTQGFTELANSLWPFAVPIVKTTEHREWDRFPGMDNGMVNETWAVIRRSKYFWENLKPLLSVREIEWIFQLNFKADLYFTTARHGVNVIDQTQNWIHDYLSIHQPNVIVSDRKGELAKALNADFMLDDKAGNVIYTAYHCHPKLGVYLLDRPYNQFDAGVVGSKVNRVASVQEYMEAIWKVL